MTKSTFWTAPIGNKTRKTGLIYTAGGMNPLDIFGLPNNGKADFRSPCYSHSPNPFNLSVCSKSLVTLTASNLYCASTEISLHD
ncbi:MAG: hypothetical protein GYA34_18830 [Chloroflexi bacterium]|nr:hypothetical protein [Chloroflexota bacterium]